jgi:uncharacterized membrane protein YcgQ (UPF0703/DUF1980 family)
MTKTYLLAVFAITAALLSFGCKKEEKTAENDAVIAIKDKMFITQINDIYLNKKDFVGKTIKLEGIFKNYESGGKNYTYVLRYGPGCCGDDGNVGFELAWKSRGRQPYPQDDSWVEATGVLGTYSEGSNSFLYLDLISLAVLEQRGQEYVSQ